MPPRRPRRGGIHTPWQDAQLKEAEELLNNLTGAADMTTAEIQRTLRAPRLDALPEVSRRRNVPELGGIDHPLGRRRTGQHPLRVAPGRAGRRRLSTGSEARAESGAVLDARLVSCNGVALQGKSQGQVMQRMQTPPFATVAAGHR